MRFKVILNTKKIPVAYQPLVMALIKTSLRKADESYYEELYLFDGKKNKQSKNFVFSTFLNQFEFEQDEIIINGDVQVTISSPDSRFMLYLYNGLSTIDKIFKYKSYQVSVGKIIIFPERHVQSVPQLFKTMSPIAVKDQQGKWLLPDDETYIKELNYITDLTLKNFRGYGLQEPLSFVVKEMKSVMVKTTNSTFVQTHEQQYLHVLCATGCFYLSGNIDDIQAIYELGLGFKRSSGWGGLEL